MSKKIKPTKSLIWLLILPLIIGLPILISNAVGSKNQQIESKHVVQKQNLKKSSGKKKARGERLEARGKKQSDSAKATPDKEEKAVNKVTKKVLAKDKKSTLNSSSASNAPKKIIINTIEISLTVNKGSGTKKYPTTFEDGSTVLDVLKTASKKYGFSLKYTNYSYGAFVEEIDSLANNPANSMYWLYYMNGKLASVGASSMKIKKGDEILWKYEKTN